MVVYLFLFLHFFFHSFSFGDVKPLYGYLTVCFFLLYSIVVLNHGVMF